MKEKLNLTKEEARAAIYNYSKEFKKIHEEIIDHTRWSVHYRVVIQRLSDGKFFSDRYSVGATECQDESAWEYNPPNFVEVEKKEKVVYIYE